MWFLRLINLLREFSIISIMGLPDKLNCRIYWTMANIFFDFVDGAFISPLELISLSFLNKFPKAVWLWI